MLHQTTWVYTYNTCVQGHAARAPPNACLNTTAGSQQWQLFCARMLPDLTAGGSSGKNNTRQHERSNNGGRSTIVRTHTPYPQQHSHSSPQS